MNKNKDKKVENEDKQLLQPTQQPKNIVNKDPTEKFRNFFNKFIQDERVVNFLTKILHYIDFSIDFVTNTSSTKYDRDPVIQVARAPINFGIWVAIFTFGFFGFWAAFFPLDQASHALGTLVVSSNRKTVQHLEGGIIKKIYVKDGAVVKEGDPLILLNNEDVKANLDILMMHHHSLKAQEARLIAQRDNKDNITFPESVLAELTNPKIKEIIESQKGIFQTAMKSYEGRISFLQKKIEQSHKQIEALKSKEDAARKQLSLYGTRVEATKKLVEKGFSSREKLTEHEARYSAVQGELGEYQGNISRIRQEINATEIEINTFKTSFMNEIVKELKDVEDQISEISSKINAVKDRMERLVITAPQDGLVHNFHYHTPTGQNAYFTVGSVIQPSQQIMDIVPQGENLEVEAKVRTQDIDAIEEGQTVKMKVTAFKMRNTPDIYGTVKFVSADIIYDRDEQGRPMPFYTVRIEIDKEKFEKNPRLRKLQLYPGMQADISIISGSKTFLRYLLDPITDSFSKSFSER